MNVSYQWLKSLVPVEWSPEELADRLTFAGLSVEQVSYFNHGIKNVIVAEILSVEEHPDKSKTKWHVCQVNTGKDTVTIVCGAPNVRPGIKVPLAQVGAELPGGIHIGPADKSGVTSYGMLCSATELDLPDGLALADSDNGIFILPEECMVGEDIVTALKLDDAILEFELTPNRADCLSVINVAREVSAISGKPLTLPEVKLPAAEGNINDYAKIDVMDKDLCPRYTAKLVKDVKIGPSPYWMRHRLAAAGIRSISNIVDISNYVMLEMNQPSHTFDYHDIADHHIIVRRAEKGEKIITLDETERELTEDMLLICDGQKAIGIAGVMGGLNSEITDRTKDILIECAYFYPKSIRQTSRKLGLASEAASRFEKGIDMEASVRASERICQLICELAGGTLVEGTLDSHDGAFDQTVVSVHYETVNATLGLEVPAQAVDDIMASLAFPMKRIEGGLKITVPYYRQDITREVDLIEEVARLYGYDKIPTSLPQGKMTEGKKTYSQKMEDKVRSLMTAAGFNELITYSFMNKKNYDDLLLAEDDSRRASVMIMNPFSDEQGVMRTILLPAVLTVAARNMKRKNSNLFLYEYAHVFEPVAGEELPKETSHVVALISGETAKTWRSQAKAVDFYRMKGILEMVLSGLGLEQWELKAEDKEPFLHPGRCAGIYVNGQYLGYLGEVHPTVMENYDMSQRSVVFDLDFSVLCEVSDQTIVYEAVSKYPAVEIDLAFVADSDVTAGSIEAVVKKVGGEYLSSVKLFDIYEGERIEAGKKSLAYSLSFQAKERTLTAEEINDSVEQIKGALEQKLHVVLRS
ncbi:MAG: phenylalanine--tRNA ligase subunit beta [Bacillota bacterium]|nr:phenylalanine--tRNA ligase subunit beta [Bacillota bacterium]